MPNTNRPRKVTILAPEVPGNILSRNPLGTYFRFTEPDVLPKPRWTLGDAYQYLGRVGTQKIARVIHVDTGRLFENIPCRAHTEPLALVSIELRPAAPDEEYIYE